MLNDIKFNTFMGIEYYNKALDYDYVIVGIPFDTACTFRVGARMAPMEIRQASKSLKSYNIDLDVNINTLLGADYGDIKIVPGYIEESYHRIEEELSGIVTKGEVPISIGGDHSITLPQLRALAKTHGPISLIQFDAHTDTVSHYLGQRYNHATTFRRGVEEGVIDPKRSVQIGIRSSVGNSEKLGFKVYTMNDVRCIGIKKIGEVIRRTVGNSKAFLTFDIDFLDPGYAPGTGTPEVGGISTLGAIEMIRKVDGLNIVGFDLVEILPAYDESNLTSHLGARLIHEFISVLGKSRNV